MATINPGITSNVASATNTDSSSSSSVRKRRTRIAGNFQTFLTLLTTQLKNQNPLDPLDTNQFTAAARAVRRRSSSSSSRTTSSPRWWRCSRPRRRRQALDFVGQTVAVDGDTAPLNGRQRHLEAVGGQAGDRHRHHHERHRADGVSPAPTRSTPASQPFIWDGKDTSGLQWPDGNYTISVTAKDANGQSVAVPTEIQAVVDSADLTQNRRRCFRSPARTTRSTSSSASFATNLACRTPHRR